MVVRRDEVRSHLPFYGFQHTAMWVAVLCLFLSGLANTPASMAAEVQLDSGPSSGSAITNSSVIAPDAMQNITGIVRVNLTAGDGNVQQNSTAFAQSSGPSAALVNAQQSANDLPQDFYQRLSAQIQDGAFNNALGVVMVNQSSGVGNAQFNGAAIAIGGVGSVAAIQLDNESLESYSASTGLGVDSANGEAGPLVEASTTLSPDSFQGARGIVMINQTAGNNNAAANSFTLSVAQ